MKRHEFVQEWSAESPYCGALVMRNSGGDVCGELADDSVHSETRYNKYAVFWLRVRPDTGEKGSDIPMVASLCLDCGSVVVDTAVHDRFHEELSDPSTRMHP